MAEGYIWKKDAVSTNYFTIIFCPITALATSIIFKFSFLPSAWDYENLWDRLSIDLNLPLCPVTLRVRTLDDLLKITPFAKLPEDPMILLFNFIWKKFQNFENKSNKLLYERSQLLEDFICRIPLRLNLAVSIHILDNCKDSVMKLWWSVRLSLNCLIYKPCSFESWQKHNLLLAKII